MDLDLTGAVVSLVPAPVGNAHAIAPASGPGHLWLADNGDVSNLVDGEIVRSDWVGGVVEVDSEGRPVVRLDPPGHAAYRGGAFRPTGVAATDGGSGADEAVWVADGYGLSLVLRYDPSGGYRGAIDGTETGTAIDCPHGLLVDRRTAWRPRPTGASSVAEWLLGGRLTELIPV